MSDAQNQTERITNEVGIVNSPDSDKFVKLFIKYVGIKLILIATLIAATGVLLLWASYEMLETNFLQFLISAIGKALFITALISVPVKWFLARQMDKIAEEKNKILIANIYEQFNSNWEFFKGDVLK